MNEENVFKSCLNISYLLKVSVPTQISLELHPLGLYLVG